MALKFHDVVDGSCDRRRSLLEASALDTDSWMSCVAASIKIPLLSCSIEFRPLIVTTFAGWATVMQELLLSFLNFASRMREMKKREREKKGKCEKRKRKRKRKIKIQPLV